MRERAAGGAADLMHPRRRRGHSDARSEALAALLAEHQMTRVVPPARSADHAHRMGHRRAPSRQVGVRFSSVASCATAYASTGRAARS
jgi:hypothetical protein